MRLYELFMGPLEQVKPWQMSGVAGVARFLDRVWRLVVNEETSALAGKLTDAGPESEPELNKALHKCIQAVEKDTLGLRFNTAISHMMTFANEATGAKTLPKAIARTFMAVLASYAPHLAEELWRIGSVGKGSCRSLRGRSSTPRSWSTTWSCTRSRCSASCAPRFRRPSTRPKLKCARSRKPTRR